MERIVLPHFITQRSVGQFTVVVEATGRESVNDSRTERLRCQPFPRSVPPLREVPPV